MRKILFHAGMSPLERPSLHHIFSDNLFTTNSSNLLFQYGAYRTLLTGDAEIKTLFVDRRRNQTRALIERINADYECVVLPLANNFRKSYNLNALTGFIRKLRIPCVVVGVGLQAPDAEGIREGYPFDDRVSDFVKAVLDHSAMLGLRGEFTAEYLKKLGFSPERHFTVTGCPSMFSAGARLPEPRVKALTPESPISFNYRKEQPGNLLLLMERTLRRMPGTVLTVQRVEEMVMMHYGLPLAYTYGDLKADLSRYPHDATHIAVREGRMAGYVSAHSWISDMKNVDLSIGCRIHGNIAAVLAGTPALVLTIDTRTEELCRYHGIPFIPAGQIDPEVDIERLCERVDFTSPLRGHAQRFRHFVDFMNANGLRHIYTDTLEPGQVPLDDAYEALSDDWGIIRSRAHIPLITRLEGKEMYCWKKIRGGITSLLR